MDCVFEIVKCLFDSIAARRDTQLQALRHELAVLPPNLESEDYIGMLIAHGGTSTRVLHQKFRPGFANSTLEDRARGKSPSLKCSIHESPVTTAFKTIRSWINAYL